VQGMFGDRSGLPNIQLLGDCAFSCHFLKVHHPSIEGHDLLRREPDYILGGEVKLKLLREMLKREIKSAV
jgi:hypothetical protein